jgi:FtsH-binding integral membrane protein
MSLFAAWFWPKVSDRKNAQFAITEAFCVAAVLALVTALLATVELMKSTSEGTEADAFVSALVFGGISYGIYRKSRLCAISGLVLYLASRVYAMATVGSRPGVISLLVALAFLHGVRGTLAYHKLPPRPAGLPSLAQSFEALGRTPAKTNESVPKQETGNSPGT